MGKQGAVIPPPIPNIIGLRCAIQLQERMPDLSPMNKK